MKRRSLLSTACAAPLALATRAFAAPNEPVIGGPCEGCEWVFDDLPKNPASTARIAPPAEPGRPLVIEGSVTTLAGAPAPGTIVYAYHTDDQGLYPPAGNRHGRLRGWARTDAAGRYRFDTIRPRAYPAREIPEHVHMHVIEPARGTYWIDDIRFTDDPLLNDGNRRAPERGGSGLATPHMRNGAWHIRRDIILGRNIPGYPRIP
jgi:protocatechuate 3,4-dioxygenase, beta subunit